MKPVVKRMAKALQGLTARHDLYRVFADSMEMMALAVANGCDRTQYDAREARYLVIAKDYSREELTQVSRLMALLTEAMTAEFADYLGELFMGLDLGSDARGQFFTPYDLCRLMARATIDDDQIQQALAARGYVTVHEPAVGAGGMVLAMEERMRALGHPGVMHVTCVDVDIKAVHMAYLQLSLAGIPAIVIHGNSLTLEAWSTWYTPVHIWQGWERKLSRQHQTMVPEEAVPAVEATTAAAGQLELFGVEP